jgi:hypothetical protein
MHMMVTQRVRLSQLLCETKLGTGITHEDIAACLQYASEILKSEKVYPATLI